MAITTIDGAIAGMQPPRYFYKVTSPTLVVGKPQSTWGLAGVPGAGSFDSTLNGVVLSSTSALVNGQLPFYNPGSGNTYLSRFLASSQGGGQVLLCDRLWHNGGYTITSTSAQNSTTPTWPARDIAGSTNGDGVLLALEISSAAGGAAPTITVTYTNSANVGSRTGAFGFPTATSPATGSFFPITLQAGDTGVRSVQSIQLNTSWLSGTMNLVAYRVLASIECITGLANSMDMLTSGFPRFYDGTVPFLVHLPQSTSGTTLAGCLSVTQG